VPPRTGVSIQGIAVTAGGTGVAAGVGDCHCGSSHDRPSQFVQRRARGRRGHRDLSASVTRATAYGLLGLLCFRHRHTPTTTPSNSSTKLPLTNTHFNEVNTGVSSATTAVGCG